MINRSYVLFIRIPIARDATGRIFCDPLWAKDLRLLLDYVTDFRICCPVIHTTSQNEIYGLEEITNFDIKQIFELKKDYGFLSVFRNFIPNLLVVKNACKKAIIVHSGGAGWAFPLSFYLLLLRPFFSFQWVIVIESSDWMLTEGEKSTLRSVITHYLYTILLAQCVRSADARIFTQTFYKKYFLDTNERTLVAPAVWIDEEHLSSPETVKKRMLDRKGQTIRLVFPARLIKEKGISVLFEAVSILKQKNVTVSITIIGSGNLERDCKEFANRDHGTVKVSYSYPVRYGPEFFNELCNYDAILVPSLKEEQPRILFDAFCQGLCAIASNTSGISDIAKNGENALLFKRGDAQDLARAICYVIEHPERLLEMGLNGLAYANGKTHLQMHLDRQRFFARVLKL